MTVKLFTVGTDVNHHVGDGQCPACVEQYPEPCRCGGLMHAAGSDEVDADGNVVPVTQCDRCGRSEDSDVH
jgi:hypothetical protein